MCVEVTELGLLHGHVVCVWVTYPLLPVSELLKLQGYCMVKVGSESGQHMSGPNWQCLPSVSTWPPPQQKYWNQIFCLVEIFVLTGRVNLFLLRSAGSRRHGAVGSCELSLVSSILFVCTLNLEMSWDVWRVERNAVRPVLGKVAMKEVQQYSSIHH